MNRDRFPALRDVWPSGLPAAAKVVDSGRLACGLDRSGSNANHCGVFKHAHRRPLIESTARRPSRLLLGGDRNCAPSCRLHVTLCAFAATVLCV